MHWLIKLAAVIAVNALALWAAVIYVPGFVIAGNDIATYFEIALIFTLLNFILKPILRLFFGPLIILTLGLGLIAVNAAVLATLDFLSPMLTIETIPALFWATILIGAVNLVLHIII